MKLEVFYSGNECYGDDCGTLQGYSKLLPTNFPRAFKCRYEFDADDVILQAGRTSPFSSTRPTRLSATPSA